MFSRTGSKQLNLTLPSSCPGRCKHYYKSHKHAARITVLIKQDRGRPLPRHTEALGTPRASDSCDAFGGQDVNAVAFLRSSSPACVQRSPAEKFEPRSVGLGCINRRGAAQFAVAAAVTARRMRSQSYDASAIRADGRPSGEYFVNKNIRNNPRTSH